MVNKLINKLRIYISFLFLVFLTIIAKPNLIFYIYGLIFVILGGMIRVYASGYILKPGNLVRIGPYSFTRNPLYFGSFLIGIGFCFASGYVESLLLLPLLYFLVYYPTILSEEKYLNETFKDEYSDYIKAIPRFFPKFSIKSLDLKSFSWFLVKKNREHQQMFFIIILFLILGIWK